MNIMAPIDCYTGYGITSYNIIKHLYEIDQNISLFPIGNPRLEPSWDQKAAKYALLNKQQYDQNKPCLKIWHANDFFLRPSGRSKYFGLTFFEIDKISEIERTSYNLLDTIIAPSQWAKDILLQNDIKVPIEVCPMGVDTITFDHTFQHPEKDHSKYVFINIGKWEIRKGHDILIDIFNKAFTKDDNVELWMLNHNPFLKESEVNSWMEKYATSNLGDKVKLYPRLTSQKLVSTLINAADCGFFPSRAEGWNNEAIETMAMDRPLIITNYSAHTEYCNKDNSFLIDIDELEPAKDDIWFNGSGNWAKIGPKQEEQMIEHLRYVYKNNIRNNPNGLRTAQSLSWEKTAQRIYDIVYA